MSIRTTSETGRHDVNDKKTAENKQLSERSNQAPVTKGAALDSSGFLFKAERENATKLPKITRPGLTGNPRHLNCM